MRQIKFRAWHTKHKQLADVAIIDFNDFGGTGTVTTEYGDEWGLEWCVLEQFTGLTDKNGKDIYEGDALMDENGRIRYFTDMTNLWRHWNIGAIKECEICGNIHDNPELI